jgi:hypothetical protein
MIADGGECISDIATLVDQAAVFGPVASGATCWRTLEAITGTALDGIESARAAARAVAWAQRAEQTGQALPASLVAGVPCSTPHADRCWSSMTTRPSWSPTARRSAPRPCSNILLRLPPGAGVLRQHQRSVCRDAAPGQRRLQHRRRSHRAARPGLGTGEAAMSGDVSVAFTDSRRIGRRARATENLTFVVSSLMHLQEALSEATPLLSRSVGSGREWPGF